MTDLLALAAGLGLVWALGIALVAAVRRTSPHDEAPPASWVIGSGWFVGVLVTTLWMRALSAAGVPFGVLSIGVPLFALALAGTAMAARGRRVSLRGRWSEVVRGLGGADLPRGERIAWRLLLGWLAIRMSLLFLEIWWRPMYPWDAWTQWGTKGRVWFEMRSMVPFVDFSAWTSAPANAAVWFDAAPHYPATMPLMQTWSALLVGAWDDTVVNLPWWFTAAALGFGVHGALRLLGLRPLPALAAAAVVLTLPILNTHVALAGYADLPMAGFLTFAAVAALHALRTRRPADAILAIALLAGVALVKNPGKAWLVVLIPAFLVAALPRRGLLAAGVLFGLGIFALLVASRTGFTLFGYRFSPTYAMPWGALFDAYFSFGNWHLLWYAALAVAVAGWRQLFAAAVAPYTVVIAGGLLFLFVGFAFSNAGAWVEDQSTVNRATLHLAPLVVVWMFVTLRERWRAPAAATLAPPSTVSPVP
jgi:hypothetical protein